MGDPKGRSLDAAALPRYAGRGPSLSAGEFERVHERQIHGSGAVITWDEATAEILREEPRHLSFALHGQKLTGRFGSQ